MPPSHTHLGISPSLASPHLFLAGGAGASGKEDAWLMGSENAHCSRVFRCSHLHLQGYFVSGSPSSTAEQQDHRQQHLWHTAHPQAAAFADPPVRVEANALGMYLRPQWQTLQPITGRRQLPTNRSRQKTTHNRKPLECFYDVVKGLPAFPVSPVFNLFHVTM